MPCRKDTDMEYTANGVSKIGLGYTKRTLDAFSGWSTLNIMSIRTVGTLFVAIAVFFSFSARAWAATYYVDAMSGNNANNGLTTETAWQNATKINSTTFTAGDQLLFKRGQVHTGTFQFHNDSGVSGNPIIVGAYGTGANPILDGASSSVRTLDLRNSASYITFQNLAIRGATTAQVFLFTGTFTGLTFQDIDIASTTGFSINGNATTTGMLLSDITFHNTTGVAYEHNNKAINDTFQNITSTGGLIRIGESAAATSTIHMSNVSVSNTPSAGLYFRKLSNSSFEDVTIVNTQLTVNIGIENTTLRNIVQSGGPGYGLNFNTGYIHNVSITNATTTNNTFDGVNFGTSSGYVGTVTVENLYSADNTRDGLAWKGGGVNSRLLVTNAVFERNGTPSNMFNGLSISGAGQATTTNSIARSNSNDGFNIKGSVHAVFDNTRAETNGTDGNEESGSGDGYSWHDTSTGFLRNSYVKDNEKGGVTNVDTTNVDIYNNVFVQEATLSTSAQANLHTSSGDVYNNTFYDSRGQGIAIRYQNTASGRVFNNIVQGFDQGIVKSTSGTFSEDYNLVHGTASAAFSGFTQGTHSLTSDPKFTDADTEDFTLLFSSPAINTGSTTAYATDYNGNSRVGVPDMGAYEFQSIPDLTAPVISNISSGTSDTSSRTITWTTDEPATSQVEYGLTASYGTLTTLDASLKTTHSVSLSGLSPNTTYHFRVISADANENEALSADETFSTASIPSEDGAGRTTGYRRQTVTTDSAIATLEARVRELQAELARLQGGTTTSVVFTRDLTIGSEGEDVRQLQRFLNGRGFSVSLTGAGSVGNESAYFGDLTREALAMFQREQGIQPAAGYFGRITRDLVNKIFGL